MLFSSLSNAPTSTTAAMEPSCTTSTTTTTTVTTNTTTTITSSINLNLRPLISTGMSNTDPFSASSVPVTSTVNSILTPVVTYSPLDDLRFELEQEKQDFLELASRLEALDRTLNENGEEIITLQGRVKKAKQDQRRLEQELNAIISRQRELEVLLSPLKTFVKDHSESVYQHNEDEEEDA